MPKDDKSLDAAVRLIKSTLKYVNGTATVSFTVNAQTLEVSNFKLANDGVPEAFKVFQQVVDQ